MRTALTLRAMRMLHMIVQVGVPHKYTLLSCELFFSEPPSMPINLRSTEVTRSAISISWTRPIFDGIRNDMYYTVQYSDPDNVGEFLDAECDGSVCLRVDECTIAGLNAATTYVIRVTAHNGVSDQDKGGALARQKEITIMTAIAREFTMNFSACRFYDTLSAEMT